MICKKNKSNRHKLLTLLFCSKPTRASFGVPGQLQRPLLLFLHLLLHRQVPDKFLLRIKPRHWVRNQHLYLFLLLLLHVVLLDDVEEEEGVLQRTSRVSLHILRDRVVHFHLWHPCSLSKRSLLNIIITISVWKPLSCVALLAVWAFVANQSKLRRKVFKQRITIVAAVVMRLCAQRKIGNDHY